MVVLGAFLAAAVPLIFTGFEYPRVADHQNRFHIRTIRAFARQWPHLDFRDYDSATTPGYHVVLALVDRFVSDDVRALRAFGAVWTVGLLATLCWFLGRRHRLAAALALALPVLCSVYVFTSGAGRCRTTRRGGACWWCCCWRCAGGWTAARSCSAARRSCAGLPAQIDLWVAAVLWVAAWLGPGPASDGAGSGRGSREKAKTPAP